MSHRYPIQGSGTIENGTVTNDHLTSALQRELDSKAAYKAIVFIDGSTIYAYSRTGTVLDSGTAGTDDRRVINSAISAVNTAGGGIVHIRPGTYVLTTQGISLVGVNNVTIEGEGIDATIIQEFGFTKNDLTQTNNVTIKDLTIDINGNNSTAMNLNSACYDFLLQRIKFMDADSNFLLNWSGASNLLVDSCIFYDGGLTTAKDNAAGSQTKDNNETSIFRHCQFIKQNSAGGAMLTTGGTGNVLVDGCNFIDLSTNSYAAVSIEDTFGACFDIGVRNCWSKGQTQGIQIGLKGGSGIQKGTIEGCVTQGTQRVFNTREAIISDSIVYDSWAAGYIFDLCDTAHISNCMARNTNLSGSATIFDKGGLFIDTNTECIIEGFTVIDDQGVGTTPYGIRGGGTGASTYITDANLLGPFTVEATRLSGDYVRIIGGNLNGNVVSTATIFKTHFTRGYVSENNGTDSIVSGTTAKIVTHGLSYTPSAAEIGITPTNNPTNTPGLISITNITSTQFTVNCENDPGASGLNFSWGVRRI